MAGGGPKLLRSSVRSPEQWQEPEVAFPKPGANGYPIGVRPPLKLMPKDKRNRHKSGFDSTVKKEKDISRRRLSRGKDSPDSDVSKTPNGVLNGNGFMYDLDDSYSSGSPAIYKSPGEEVSNSVKTDTTKPEEKFMIRLKTNFSEKLSKSSYTRQSSKGAKSIRPIPPTPSPDPNIASVKLETPKRSRNTTPVSESPKAVEPDKRRKRIKISTPKKNRENPFGIGAKHDLSGEPRPNTNNNITYDDITKDNDDFCSTCNGIGRLLCCETCSKSFHFTCVDPPLDEYSLPEGEWSCRECYTLRHPPLPYKRGLFSQMLNQLERRNPKIFALPKGLRERFEGVSTSETGEYQDSEEISAIVTRNFRPSEDTDISKLMDKNGKPMLCFKCGLSALGDKPLTTCDYCSLHWHLDCHNPPLPSVKAPGSLWKCQNHADRAFKPARRYKKPNIVDVNLKRGFRNDGNIDVQNSSDDDMESSEIPPFDTSDTEEGVRAIVPEDVVQTFTIDGIVYRLPARGIKLDFIEFVKSQNEDPWRESNASEILLALDEIATKHQPEREAVRNLCYLQSSESSAPLVARAKQNLSSLLDAALSTEGSEYSFSSINSARIGDSIPYSTNGSHTGSSLDPERDISTDGSSIDDEFLPGEKHQLMAVKKLMELKGKDELLKFLLPN